MEMLKIQDSDFNVLNEIAKKHNLTVYELGRLISDKKEIEKKEKSRLRLFCEVDDFIYCDLTKKANAFNCTLSRYAVWCCAKAIRQELFKTIEIADIIKGSMNMQKDSGKMNNYINTSFDENFEDVLKEMEEITEVFCLNISPLLRYFITTITLNKEDIILLNKKGMV